MDNTPYKGPIRNFQRYIIKYTTDNHLTKLARNFPNINKWTSDINIDRISSNTFWTNPQISGKKKLNNLLSSAPINIWEMLKNTFSGLYDILPIHVPYALQILLTHGHMSFSLVPNHIYMPFISNVIKKLYENYTNC